MTMLQQFIDMRPAGGFDLIMADPPWHFALRDESHGAGKSPQAQYQCMSLDQIAEMPVSVLAADNCALWLWATNPMIPQALQVMAAWGFTFKTGGHWVKTTKHGKLAFGTGYLLRCAGEPYLIGTRGAPKTAKNVRSVIMAQIREHSRKPDLAFSEAERWIPDARRLELFSRQSRPGWSTWGNEAGKFDEDAA